MLKVRWQIQARDDGTLNESGNIAKVTLVSTDKRKKTEGLHLNGNITFVIIYLSRTTDD